MMKLEHANLVVKEIKPTLDFLLTAFPRWKVRGSGKSAWNDTQRNWVHVGNTDYYITLNDHAKGERRDNQGEKPGLAHLGFAVSDLNDVIERLTKKGYEIDIIGRDHPYRQSIYFCDPAGCQFEFIQYKSVIPEEKNMYGGETGELNQHPIKLN